MRAVALLVSSSIALTGCFPNNARHRTIAKVAEGASLATGIGILYFANSGADCEPVPGVPNSDCKRDAGTISSVGLGLIVIGLLGFVITVSTSPDDPPPAPPPITLPPPDPPQHLPPPDPGQRPAQPPPVQPDPVQPAPPS